MANVVPPDETTDQIVVHLEELGTDQLGVRAIELSVSSVMVRFSAPDAQGLDDTFQPQFGGIIRSICDGALHSPGTIQRPDFCLRQRGLTLEGYEVTRSLDDAGTYRIQLKFHRARGNALSVFRLSSRTDTGISLFTPRILSGPDNHMSSQRLFDDMLSQLYLPLVNLNAYLRHVLDGSTPQRGEPLSHSVVQLKTRAETLQYAFDRLIADMMMSRFSEAPHLAPALPNSNAA